MHHIVRTLLALLCLIVIGGTPTEAGEYRLGPGDVVNISIWGLADPGVPKTDQISGQGSTEGYLVSPDGKIALPLVGEINVEGLTTSELTVVVTQAIGEYVTNPKVAVNLVKLRTTRVYVLGEVNRPGLYELEKMHNVLDAIGAAGGYTQYAAKKHIFLIRAGKADQPIKLDLVKLLQNGDISQNYMLAEGDLVYLSTNGKIDFSKDILPFISGAYYINHFNND